MSRHATDFVAVAGAEGGVLVHCGAGRDRTGLITAMLLSLAGVARSAIVDDYEAGVRETHAFLLTMDTPFEPVREPDQFEAEVAAALRSLDTLLSEFDVETYLLEAGVSAEQLARIRSRLLD